MLLNPDGTFDIDFDTKDGPLRVHVRQPKVGAFKRVKAETRKVDARLADMTAEWETEQAKARADDGIPAEIPALDDDEARDAASAATLARWAADGRELRSRVEEAHEAELLGWWSLVLLGDDTFASLADPAPPSDTDDWPIELTTNLSVGTAITHWLTPLVRGDLPEPTANEATPPADL